MATEQPRPARPAARRKRPRWLPWAIGALVVLIVLVVWLLARGGDDAKTPAAATGKPTIMSEAQLRAFGRAQAVPVYWAGPRSNRQYEVTRTSGGRIYVRYIPQGASAGIDRPGYLTVGTYPGTKAYEALQVVAKSPGTKQIQTRSGALVVYSTAKPSSVYFAFPNQNFQVEVFSPEPGRARRLALGGQVAPVR